MGEEATENNKNEVRDTLFIWDGILTIDEEVVNRKKSDVESVDELDDLPVSWEGTWVSSTNSTDASKVDAPVRGTFDAFVDSQMKFKVQGTAKRVDGYEEQFKPYTMNMIDGDGWDSPTDSNKEEVNKEKDKKEGEEKDDENNKVVDEEIKKHKQKDTEHNLYLTSLRWSGDLRDKRKNLIFAIGSNDKNGSFISSGWMRPGNRLTLARRYVDKDDPRSKWSIDDLRKAILTEVFNNESKEVITPSWKCKVMNSTYEEEEGKAPANKKQKVDTN